MPKRDLYQYEYRCDGMTPRGVKCEKQIVVSAYDSNDADHRVTQIRSAYFGLAWTFTAKGWLCTSPHRDDPRPSDYVPLQTRERRGDE